MYLKKFTDWTVLILYFLFGFALCQFEDSVDSENVHQRSKLYANSRIIYVLGYCQFDVGVFN